MKIGKINPPARSAVRLGGSMRIPHMPLEWLGLGSWSLPSGKALAEFALQAGFLAPLLLKTEGYSRPRPQASRLPSVAPATPAKKEG